MTTLSLNELSRSERRRLGVDSQLDCLPAAPEREDSPLQIPSFLRPAAAPTIARHSTPRTEPLAHEWWRRRA